MEDVLGTYEKPYNQREPVVCFDEKSKQLLETPRTASRSDRLDYEYKRAGTRNLFLATELLTAWRDVQVTKRRARVDFANYIKYLLEEAFPSAEVVHMILDNLNTHNAKSLVEAFGEEAAASYLARIEWHYTPKHASWLNAAESELSVLERQCLSRRIATEKELRSETTAWCATRNREGMLTDWTFTRDKARTKFRTLYAESQH